MTTWVAPERSADQSGARLLIEGGRRAQTQRALDQCQQAADILFGDDGFDAIIPELAAAEAAGENVHEAARRLGFDLTQVRDTIVDGASALEGATTLPDVSDPNYSAAYTQLCTNNDRREQRLSRPRPSCQSRRRPHVPAPLRPSRERRARPRQRRAHPRTSLRRRTTGSRARPGDDTPSEPPSHAARHRRTNVASPGRGCR